uniref:Orphan G-protein coupled receptor 16 n=1 Tax=Platynereis dumerilii TaxID=6359 RepID=A0A0K0PUS0_PLADU|nr:orphan G-protein coupled receptor 16 [Platynereis dumerilii]
MDAENATRLYGTQSLKSFSDWYASYHGYVSLVVCAYGIISNIFNILVLTRKNMWTTTNCILTGLAFSDLLTMMSYVPFALQFYVLHGLDASPQRNSHPWVLFFLFHVNFSVTTHTISTWLGVLLSVYRYTYIRLSSDSSVKCSLAKTKIMVLLVYAYSMMVLIPNYLSVEIRSYPMDNNTIYNLAGIDTNTTYGITITTINFWLHALVIKLIPCAMMSIFGFLLVFTMRSTHARSKRLRRQNTVVSTINKTRKKEHSRTTRMLVVVIILFLITELPHGILALLCGLLPGFFEAVYVPLGDVMDIVALINNAVNFTLYCSMSKQFRETFIRLFCPNLESPFKKRACNGTTTIIHDNNVSCRLVQRTPSL